jgi:putative Ca2+/H+ antiporter (TMEM165/GDT1 family)
MLREGLLMSSGTDSVQDEIKEVEQELQEKDFAPVSPNGVSSPTASHPVNAEALEAGSWKPRKKSTAGVVERASGGVMNLMNLLFSPVFVQTFVMTFLGEWGDRSQIATITLAAASGNTLQSPRSRTFIQFRFMLTWGLCARSRLLFSFILICCGAQC